jgi:hypothetical protein
MRREASMEHKDAVSGWLTPTLAGFSRFTIFPHMYKVVVLLPHLLMLPIKTKGT